MLVDFTEFLVRDWNNMAGRLQPGAYRFEANRSFVHMAGTAAFPKNTEMEAELAFVQQPGGAVRPAAGAEAADAAAAFEGVGSVASTGEAASIRVHHSIAELPDAGYKPRHFDPRSGTARSRTTTTPRCQASR